MATTQVLKGLTMCKSRLVSWDTWGTRLDLRFTDCSDAHPMIQEPLTEGASVLNKGKPILTEVERDLR